MAREVVLHASLTPRVETQRMRRRAASRNRIAARDGVDPALKDVILRYARMEEDSETVQ